MKFSDFIVTATFNSSTAADFRSTSNVLAASVQIQTTPHILLITAYLSMCKHILNAQVSVRAPCCKQWFDCPECHAEKETHRLTKTMEMVFLCKKCKKAFRKDMTAYEESDEYCPHCDNHYVIDAKTPQAVVGVEGEDARVDARMLKDDRVKQVHKQSVFQLDDDDFVDRIG